MWLPALNGVPGAARTQLRFTLPLFLPAALVNTWPYHDVLELPPVPVPFEAAEAVQETFDAGMAGPPGGTKSPSALTLICSTRLPEALREENDTVDVAGFPLGTGADVRHGEPDRRRHRDLHGLGSGIHLPGCQQAARGHKNQAQPFRAPRNGPSVGDRHLISRQMMAFVFERTRKSTPVAGRP